MEVFSFILVMLVIWGCMWLFFKFMYPKPPKAFMPQQGDIITPRKCDYCGYSLAEYRGIVEAKSSVLTVNDGERTGSESIGKAGDDSDSNEGDNRVQNQQALNRQVSREVEQTLSRRERKQQARLREAQKKQSDSVKREQELANTWFFCNGEHQAKFHAGETYAQNK